MSKIRSKVINLKKHIYTPLGNLYVQYENNPVNALRDIVRKLNLLSTINKVDNRLKTKGQKLGQRS